MGDSVRLTVVPSEGAAEVFCAMLRAESIPCFNRPTDVAAEGGIPFLSGADWREVLVREDDDLDRARELLAAVEPLYAECVECGRPIGDGRWYSDGPGELMPYCAGCAEREFG